MGVDRRRPKKRWFAVAIVLPELAVVLAIVYRALSLLTFADTVDRFDRFTSVGELAQPFDRGDVHIDAELDSVETSAATDPPSIPQIEVVPPDGSPVVLVPYSRLPGTNDGWTYEISPSTPSGTRSSAFSLDASRQA